MRTRIERRLFLPAVISALAALFVAASARADDLQLESLDALSWPADRGFSVQLDNDLFSGAHRDEDYSWGFAVSVGTPTAHRLAAPIDAMRKRLGNWLTPGAPQQDWSPQSRAVQLGILAMTPETLRSADPLLEDRPFANLIFVNSAELRVLENTGRARYTSFTVGVLGLEAAEILHRAIHKVVGDEQPLGWDHEISEGGEPTARYVQAEQWLIGGRDAMRADLPELKLTAGGSVGFLTEGSLALSARWGRIQSPWWSFTPELADYTAAPVAPFTRLSSQGLTEMFLFAGGRVKARAYNALLQGQFRHSDVRVFSDELARLQAEAWIGLATTWSDLRVTYTIRYASREMTREPGARSLIWAGFGFEKAF